MNKHRWIVVLALICGLAASAARAHDSHSHRPAPESTIESSAGLIERFRQTGNDDYLDRAWQSMQPVIHDPATASVDELVDAATVAQARHDFDTALELIDRVTERAPTHDQAWLTASSIHLVRGDTESARQACRRLRRVELLIVTTCLARCAVGAERATLGNALDALLARRSAGDDRALAWALAVRGDIAVAAGELESAVAYYRNSLALSERTQVRAALLDTLIRLERFDEAHAVLADGSNALPLAVRRFVVERALGAADSMAADIAETDRRFRLWMDAGDLLHAREMTRFYLDVLPVPELARELATANLARQREPEDLLLARRASVRGGVAPIADNATGD